MHDCSPQVSSACAQSCKKGTKEAEQYKQNADKFENWAVEVAHEQPSTALHSPPQPSTAFHSLPQPSDVLAAGTPSARHVPPRLTPETTRRDGRPLHARRCCASAATTRTRS